MNITLKTKLARKIQVPALKTSWLLPLSIYKVSKFGPEIFTAYTKNLSVKYESRSVFYKTKTLSSKQHKLIKFLPERISHDLQLILASLSGVK